LTSRAFPFSTHLGCVADWCDDRDIALNEMPTNPAWGTWRSPRVAGIRKTVDGGGLEGELVFGAGA
jgi:hypothetical protein